LPQLKYIGRWASIRTPVGVFLRHQAQEVEQGWLDARRGEFAPSHWVITEDAKAGTVDEGNDGIPDNGWLRADILTWLEREGVPVRVGLTKKQALSRVNEHLNPVIEEVVEEVESTEEDNTEEALGVPNATAETGDDE